MASRPVQSLLICGGMAAAVVVGYSASLFVNEPRSGDGASNDARQQLRLAASDGEFAEDDGDATPLALLGFDDSLDDESMEFSAGGQRGGGVGQSNKPAPPANASGGSDLALRCVDVAYEIDQELGGQLARKQQQNPGEFDRMIRHGQMGRRLTAMAMLKQRDPNLYQIKLSELSQNVQINRVAAEWRDAVRKGNTRQADALREQLRSLLRIQLAMSMKTRAEYLCRIEEQIQSLRDEISHQAEHFQATVEGRLQQLGQEPAKSGEGAISAMPVSAALPERK